MSGHVRSQLRELTLTNSTPVDREESPQIDLTMGLPYLGVLFGRRTNELFHRMQKAWLTLRQTDIDRISTLWQDLRLLSRLLASDEIGRTKIREVVDFWQEGWDAQFTSEWRADLVHQLRDDLQAIALNRPTRQNAATFDVVIAESIQGVIAQHNEAMRMIHEVIDVELHEAISFGRSLDQLANATNVVRLCNVEYVNEPLTDRAWNPGSPHSRPSEVVSLVPSDDPIAVPMDQIDELQLRWRQLGLPSCDFPDAVEMPPQAVIAQIESALGACPPQINATPSVEPESHPAFLGLSVVGVIVQRVGFESVEVSQPLTRGLIERLIDAGDRPVPRNDLISEWEDLGGRATLPELGTVRAAIRQARTALRPLGVEIENIGRIAWKLRAVE